MNAAQRWQTVASVAAFAFPALSVAVPNGYSIAALFLLVGALAATAQWWRRPLEPRMAWHLVFSFLFMAAIWQIDGLRSDGGWRSVDKPAKFVAVLPCLFLLLRFPPRQDFLWAGIGCGAIGSGLVAIYECFWRHLPRAEGAINAIQFGNLSLLLGLMCVVGLMMWRPARFKWISIAVMAAGVLLGVLGSLLSQSRGGWLALVLLLPVLVSILWRFLDRRYLAISGAIALLCGAALLSLTAQQLSDRVDKARSEVELYETTGDAATSVGQRLDHWKLAWRLGLSRPLVGWAQKGYEEEKGRLVAAGQAHPFLLQFNHAHNEFLDLFAKRGILGLGALLYLYAVPLVLFWPRRSSVPPPPTTLSLQIIGVLIPVTYIGCGLTQGFLGHNSGTMFFVFMTVLTFSTLQGERRLLTMAPGR
jgi:O-antigen ligase